MSTTAAPSATRQRASMGVVAAIGASVAYGVSPVLARFALDYEIDVPALLFIRFVIASAALWLLWFSFGPRLVPGRLRADRLPADARRAVIVRAAALGVVVYAAQLLTFTYALERLGAALA